MKEGNRPPVSPPAGTTEHSLPPAWQEFIRYCRELRHGEIERLCIQDGLPVLAETIRKKVKFNGAA
jgi:hypothetical protein